jgi:BsaWI restriction endonuclease type 2
MVEQHGLPLTLPLLTDSAAQAKRVLGGRAFETTIMTILTRFLESDGIVVVTGKSKALLAVMEDPANVDEIVSYTRLPVKRRCTQTQLEDYPDSDLFALVRPHHPTNPWRLLAIINCKVNFHSRETEAAFWGLSVRTSSYIKYVCVTEDRDIYAVGQSELGASCRESRKARRLLESYTDRLYLCKRYSGIGDPILGRDVDTMLHQLDRERPTSYPVFDDPSVPHHTQYCHLVRPLDDLINDLRRWKQEIPAAE